MLGALLLGCVLPSYEESPAPPPPTSVGWSYQLGGVMDEGALDAATDAAGNVILVGSHTSYMSFDGGESFVGPAQKGDAFVVKIDEAGHHLFSRTFGDDEAQGATRIDVDRDDAMLVAGYLFGTITLDPTTVLTAGLASSVFLTKLDAEGDLVWARAFKDAGNYWALGSGDVAVDSEGSALFVGSWCGTVDFSAGDDVPGQGPVTDSLSYNAFISKRDGATGNLRWLADIRADSDVLAYGVAVDASDNVLVTGYYQGNATLTDADGTATPIPGGADRALFVLKLSSSGKYLWGLGIDDPGNQEGYAVATDAGNNAVVTGYSSSTEEGEIAPAGIRAIALKVGPSGDLLWSSAVDGLDHDAGYVVAADTNGGVLLAGNRRPFFRAPGELQLDVLLAAIDGQDGLVRATQTFGGLGSQIPTAITLDAQDNVILAGSFEQQIDFGSGALESKGGQDIFVAKLPHP